jgi:L-asparaginase II
VTTVPYAELARVTRSGFVESRHLGSVVVLDPSGAVALRAGVPDEPVLPRSTLKPAQALACLTAVETADAGSPAGRALAGPALAIAAGSHTGDDRLVAVVRELLTAAGLGEDALACPADWPEDEPTRERLIRAGNGGGSG